MFLKSQLLEALAHPALLPQRERVRRFLGRARGIQNRIRARVSPNAKIPNLLSVIVPVYNVENFVEETLRSIAIQNYRNIEIIVVDDGSPDRSYEIVREFARKEPRVRIIRQPNGGLSVARNTGVKHARGEFLAFIDSDDTVERHAFAPVIATLKSTGSDFAVSPYRRLAKGHFLGAAWWIDEAHRKERLRCTLKDFPDIVINPTAWSKVFRRDFWEAAGLTFSPGALYEDQILTSLAYAKADSFDVLTDITVNWRIRDDGTSISQQLVSIPNLQGQLSAALISLKNLESEGKHRARDVRLSQYLANDFAHPLPYLPDFDDDQWDVFVAALKTLTGEVKNQAVWENVPARTKVLYYLIVEGHRSDANHFVLQGGLKADNWPTTVVGKAVRATISLLDDLASTVPEEFTNLALSETKVKSAAFSLTWDEGSLATIEGVAYISNLDPSENEATLTLTLVNDESGLETQLKTTRTEAEQAVSHRGRFTDPRASAFRASIDADSLQVPGKYSIRIDINCGLVHRTGFLKADPGMALVSNHLPSGDVADAIINRHGALELAVNAPRFSLRSAEINGRNIHLAITGDGARKAALVMENDRFALKRSVTKLKGDGGQVAEGNLVVPPAKMDKVGHPRPAGNAWRIEAQDAAGQWAAVFASEAALGPDPSLSLPALSIEQRATGRLTTTEFIPTHLGRPDYHPGGGARVVDRTRSILITAVHLDGSHLAISARAPGTVGHSVSATMHSGQTEVEAEVLRPEEGTLTLRFPLEDDRWQSGTRPIPARQYSLRITSDGLGAEVPVTIDARFVAYGRKEFVTEKLRVSLSQDSYRAPLLTVAAPLALDERRGGNQGRLALWSHSLQVSGPKSVLFRSLYGEVANDSAKAVHDELQRRGTDLDLIWSVTDYSVPVPAGGRAVIEGSREHYEAFGTADYVMVNVHQPDWMVKKKDQVLIETFHGYPFKLAGKRWWKKAGFTPSRVESFLARALDWDYLVSPAGYATPFLKEFLPSDRRFPGTILEIGYPRNDIFFAPDADDIRDMVRRRIGIRDDQTAVLYAPTFRDYLSPNDMTATMVDFVDYDKLARDLGDDYVVLLRGHPFHARGGAQMRGNVRDVTHYPDISELILAADAAVLDYSSLRFDFALTRKPMIFLVPDHERYFSGREGFVDYAQTAPGPWVHGHSDLLRELRTLSEVKVRFGEHIETFVKNFMELEDGHATDRLIDAVFASRGDA